MSIWINNDEAGYNCVKAVKAPAYLSAEQALRLERIAQARLLNDGKHRQYFLDQGRSQFAFPEMRTASGFIGRPYITYNLLGLVSNKCGDLLFGQEPIVRATEEKQQQAIDALIERCQLHAMLIGMAAACSAEAECFIESCVYAGQVFLREVDSASIYPLGPMMPDKQHQSYVRFEQSADGKLLLITTYTRGSINRELYEVDSAGKCGKRMDVNAWPLKPAEDDGLWGEDVKTGMTANVVTWIPNLLRTNGRPISDYDGAIDQQDKVNAANTQIARVLAKHADPKMAFPRGAFDETGNIRSERDAYAVNTPEDAPSYITWSGELEAAMKDRSFAVNALLIRTEMSPVLLGLKEGAAPDSYKKTRLEAFNSLSKAQRKSLYFAAGLRRAIQSACELENQLNGRSGYAIGDISVQLRDGIPIDDGEQANTIATLMASGAMSEERAVELQIPDAAGQEKELERLAARRAAATPSIFFGAEQGAAAAEQTQTSGEGTGGTTDPAEAAPSRDQSGAVATNDLRATVGGSQAVREMQKMYYAGELPREACMANAKIVFGFTDAEAAELFPDVAPDAPGNDDAKNIATDGARMATDATVPSVAIRDIRGK